MAIDETFLRIHQRHEDTRLGYAEEFLHPTLGGGRTVAVLATPLGPARPVGWVVCHSFSMEQIHLGRLDVAVARALASAGFPTLRYHGQGYGDSEYGMDRISLESHLADARGALAILRDRLGVQHIGVIGARFGGTVAGLVAAAEQLPFAVLVEPQVRGSLVMREFLRTRVMSELTGTAVVKAEREGVSKVQDLRRELEVQGWADIKGFALSRAAHDEISAIDLEASLEGFRGTVLLIAVSRSERPSGSMEKLFRRLDEGGAACSIEVMQDRIAPQFGQFHFVAVNGGRGKVDVQLDLEQKIADRISAWSAGSTDRIPDRDASQ
jgi:pimeloyl-ACP methyl ester carboxylesterase